jgi:hypothetical protein
MPMWLPLPDILCYWTTIPHLWPRILSGHKWAMTLGLPFKRGSPPNHCHHWPRKLTILSSSIQNRPSDHRIYCRTGTIWHSISLSPWEYKPRWCPIMQTRFMHQTHLTTNQSSQYPNTSSSHLTPWPLIYKHRCANLYECTLYPC